MGLPCCLHNLRTWTTSVLDVDGFWDLTHLNQPTRCFTPILPLAPRAVLSLLQAPSVGPEKNKGIGQASKPWGLRVKYFTLLPTSVGKRYLQPTGSKGPIPRSALIVRLIIYLRMYTGILTSNILGDLLELNSSKPLIS